MYREAEYPLLPPQPSVAATILPKRVKTVTIRRAPPTTRPKFADRLDPGAPQPQVTPTAAPAAAVAQRVVLYEEDPADPQGKRLVGSAIWRTETISPGAGRSPELAVRADIEIPERKLAMTWLLRRNGSAALPARAELDPNWKDRGPGLFNALH